MLVGIKDRSVGIDAKIIEPDVNREASNYIINNYSNLLGIIRGCEIGWEKANDLIHDVYISIVDAEDNGNGFDMEFGSRMDENGNIDVNLMNEIGKEFANYFKSKQINKVVTIESSGIAPAFATASALNVPMIVFKKQHSSILNNDLYETKVHSFTKNSDYILTASKRFLKENENILIIDDFLANGEAVLGTSRILSMAKCNVAGVGIVIEKAFQPGRNKIEDAGLDIYSLTRISKLGKGIIEFI